MTNALKIPIGDYGSDQVGAPVPTLNSSVATKLLTKSPLHAWYSHPRLNPSHENTSNEAMELGTACHAVLLENNPDIIVVVEATDWRTNEAKQQRDWAKADGKVALLPHEAAKVFEMVTAANNAIAASPDLDGIGECVPEQTFVWEEERGGHKVWLRCRPDWVTKDNRVILSYKTTGQNAEPDAYVKTMLNGGFEMQAAFELSGVEAVTGVRPTHYIWITQEVQPPCAVSLIGLSDDLRDYGMSRMDAAVMRWAECLETNTWPGYPNRVCYVSAPGWARNQWEERQALNELHD